jgi:hypothetical protein
MERTRSTVKGRFVEVDTCEGAAGFVLSVGPVSLWLRPAVAADVLDTLARALAVEESEAVAKSPAALRRKNSS